MTLHLQALPLQSGASYEFRLSKENGMDVILRTVWDYLMAEAQRLKAELEQELTE